MRVSCFILSDKVSENCKPNSYFWIKAEGRSYFHYNSYNIAFTPLKALINKALIKEYSVIGFYKSLQQLQKASKKIIIRATIKSKSISRAVLYRE
jgi:hypothetical protein